MGGVEGGERARRRGRGRVGGCSICIGEIWEGTWNILCNINGNLLLNKDAYTYVHTH